jgi:nicotinate phosphoribosyltransferase
MNFVHFQSMIAAKAARVVLAAQGKPVIDFGLRRAHGAEAGVMAARASYIAGFTGTATVEAEKDFGIPTFGTMAHSYVQAHDDETEAFERFARARPDNLTLLIDTYDTEAGARKVVRLAKKLARDGIRVSAVRIDSGDLVDLSRRVRAIFDDGGLADIGIFASGGLDEDRIAAMRGAGAPIDGFGVGTSVTTSSDAPTLDIAYKLVEYAGRPRRKQSPGKETWPGRKQVWRRSGTDAHMCGDTLGLEYESRDGAPLLVPVMRDGRRVGDVDTLADIRARVARELERLPAALRRLDAAAPYPVTPSEALRDLARELDNDVHKT